VHFTYTQKINKNIIANENKFSKILESHIFELLLILKVFRFQNPDLLLQVTTDLRLNTIKIIQI